MKELSNKKWLVSIQKCKTRCLDVKQYYRFTSKTLSWHETWLVGAAWFGGVFNTWIVNKNLKLEAQRQRRQAVATEGEVAGSDLRYLAFFLSFTNVLMTGVFFFFICLWCLCAKWDIAFVLKSPWCDKNLFWRNGSTYYGVYLYFHSFKRLCDRFSSFRN